MNESHLSIERLSLPADDDDVLSLAELLVDTVESGAAVSFVLPLWRHQAEAWWRKTLAASHPKAVYLVARDPKGIAGSVQLQPAWAPNQPHRAEVVKMMVHRRARGRGLGTALLHAVERAARGQGFSLLTLDAKAGTPAERLYRRHGWTCVGTIPRFAFDPDARTPHDTVVFYKEIADLARAP